MKIRFTDADARRAGTEADLLPAAAEHLIAKGRAVAVEDDKPKPAKKTVAKKAASSKPDA